jgi:hypothetical protein
VKNVGGPTALKAALVGYKQRWGAAMAEAAQRKQPQQLHVEVLRLEGCLLPLLADAATLVRAVVRVQPALGVARNTDTAKIHSQRTVLSLSPGSCTNGALVTRWCHYQTLAHTPRVSGQHLWNGPLNSAFLNGEGPRARIGLGPGDAAGAGADACGRAGGEAGGDGRGGEAGAVSSACRRRRQRAAAGEISPRPFPPPTNRTAMRSERITK